MGNFREWRLRGTLQVFLAFGFHRLPEASREVVSCPGFLLPDNRRQSFVAGGRNAMRHQFARQTARLSLRWDFLVVGFSNEPYDPLASAAFGVAADQRHPFQESDAFQLLNRRLELSLELSVVVVAAKAHVLAGKGAKFKDELIDDRLIRFEKPRRAA